MWLFKKRPPENDEELASRYFREGDKDLLGRLFEQHVSTVYGVCLFYFKDRDVAQDQVMQIFEKLLLELRRNEVKNFKGWLSFVVRNHCLNELRKNKNRHHVSEHYLDFEVKDANLEEEEKIAELKEEEMLVHLAEVLPLLKEKQRECVELFYLQGKSYEEIAHLKGYSPNEVKSYLQNGKRNLKLMIQEKLKNNNHAA